MLFASHLIWFLKLISAHSYQSHISTSSNPTTFSPFPPPLPNANHRKFQFCSPTPDGLVSRARKKNHFITSWCFHTSSRRLPLSNLSSGYSCLHLFIIFVPALTPLSSETLLCHLKTYCLVVSALTLPCHLRPHSFVITALTSLSSQPFPGPLSAFTSLYLSPHSLNMSFRYLSSQTSLVI